MKAYNGCHYEIVLLIFSLQHSKSYEIFSHVIHQQSLPYEILNHVFSFLIKDELLF